MSITPAGKRRDQVNQGMLKNQTILDSIMGKVAITGLGDLDQKQQPQSPEMDLAGLRDTMNSGGLDHGGQADLYEQMGMGEMPPGKSITPNNPEVGGQRGISPFLQGNEELDAESAEMNQALLMERQKIQKVLGGAGFQMDLSNTGKDGGIKLILTPQQGFQLTPDNWEQLLRRLAQAGINPTVINDPDASGRTTIVYNNNAGPQKVTKK